MKKYLMLVILLTASFTMIACTSKQNVSESGDISSSTNPKMDTDRRGIPDFGQPSEQPEIRGLVTKIIGNEVTVLKIGRPARDNASSSDARAGRTQTENGARQGGGQSGGQGGNFRTGGGGFMPGVGGVARTGGGAQTAESQAAMLERIKAMSTGEEKIIIPVGIQMLKPDTALTDKPSMLEATLSDVKPNTMINVWLNKDVTDKKVASFVMVTR